MADTGLTKILHAAEAAFSATEQKIDSRLPALDFAPLLEKAPALTRQTIETAFETLAKHCEAAGEAIMQAALERVAEAKHTAARLRELGVAHGVSVEQLMGFARDASTNFKSTTAQAQAFRPVDVAALGAGAIGVGVSGKPQDAAVAQ